MIQNGFALIVVQISGSNNYNQSDLILKLKAYNLSGIRLISVSADTLCTLAVLIACAISTLSEDRSKVKLKFSIKTCCGSTTVGIILSTECFSHPGHPTVFFITTLL